MIMFTQSDYDKLQQIMEESPEKKDLLSRLLESHQINISTISHEIRNPLTMVYSTIQLIESAHPEVASFAHWDDLHLDLEYMIQLLEELSSYNNGNKLHLTQTDMTAYLQKFVLSYASSIADTNLEFRSYIDPQLPAMMIDTIKLQQVLINLLKNACDAVHACPECERPSITFTAEYAENSQILIQVSDTGCGIKEEDISTIFEPFVTHKSTGTGLGLAVADRIIRAHHGSIQVKSTPGNGTTFTLRLPVQ